MSGAVLKAGTDEDRFLLCVAYSCNTIPRRGADKRIDLASPRVLEKACWRFAANGFKVGIGHRPGGENAAKVVENFVHRGPTWKIAAPDGTVQRVKKGDWCVGLVLSPEAWAAYKRGEFGGVSLQGSAGRKPPSAETLARVRGSVT